MICKYTGERINICKLLYGPNYIWHDSGKWMHTMLFSYSEHSTDVAVGQAGSERFYCRERRWHRRLVFVTPTDLANSREHRLCLVRPKLRPQPNLTKPMAVGANNASTSKRFHLNDGSKAVLSMFYAWKFLPPGWYETIIFAYPSFLASTFGTINPIIPNPCPSLSETRSHYVRAPWTVFSVPLVIPLPANQSVNCCINLQLRCNCGIHYCTKLHRPIRYGCWRSTWRYLRSSS